LLHALRTDLQLIGHREYDRKVLALHPWEIADLRRYPQSAFREDHCVLCSRELASW
jgi:hypothetical protein